MVDLPVAPGDYVHADDVVVVLETDKVSVDVRSPENGALIEVLAEVDQIVEVGASLFRIDTDAVAPDGAAVPTSKAVKGNAPPPPPPAEAAAPAPPPAASESKPSSSSPPPPKPSPPPSKPSTGAPPPSKSSSSSSSPPPKATAAAPIESVSISLGHRTERRTKMSRMRQRVAARLKDAQNTAAMLTTFQECDMGNLMELRTRHQELFVAKHQVKLGFMSAFVKAATAALIEVPVVNAYMDTTTQEVVYRDYCDISVAVASPNGLVVPVLRNTETMSFADVERNIALYGQKAKEGTLSLDDMAGGTFTISNGGVFGSLMGTPIINPPQSAILGMHATKLRPVVIDGQVVARPMMYLALTYDHRLIDGREAVTFLKSIADKVADPTKLLLDI